MAHNPVFTKTVHSALYDETRGWSEHSVWIIAGHIEELTQLFCVSPLQYTIDFFILTTFAKAALDEHPNTADTGDLVKTIRLARYILNGIVYHAMLSQYDREAIYSYLESIGELAETLASAHYK